MIQKALQLYQYVDLSLLGMFLFLFVFLGNVALVSRPSAAKMYEEMGRKPLED